MHCATHIPDFLCCSWIPRAELSLSSVAFYMPTCKTSCFTRKEKASQWLYFFFFITMALKPQFCAQIRSTAFRSLSTMLFHSTCWHNISLWRWPCQPHSNVFLLTSLTLATPTTSSSEKGVSRDPGPHQAQVHLWPTRLNTNLKVTHVGCFCMVSREKKFFFF